MPNAYTLPPGPPGLPLFGNVFQFGRDQLGFLTGLQRRYGRLATMRIGRTPVVVLFEPEHIRHVLRDHAENFTNREVAGGLVFGKLLLFSQLTRTFSRQATESLRQVLGDGLITTDGAYHDRQRRLLQPAFSRRRVDGYAGLIVACAQETIDRWQPGGTLDLAPEIQALILRVMVKILIDVDIATDVPESADLIHGILSQPVSFLEGVLNLPVDLPITAYGKRMAAVRRCDALIYRLLAQRADAGDTGDIVSILLTARDENGHRMTPRQVRDELMSLIAAGHETTTNTLLWTLYLLSEHPAVFHRTHAELERVLAGRPPAPEDLPRLSYLGQVIKESMRLYPSGWVQGRRAIDDFELDGYRFPAGTLVLISQWVLHRRPDLWPEADTFRPERWDPACAQQPVPWAYLPFGGGPRVCLGQSLSQLELHLVLPMILQRYHPRVVPGRAVEPEPLITLRPKYGLPVTLAPVPAPARDTAAEAHTAAGAHPTVGAAACPFEHSSARA